MSLLTRLNDTQYRFLHAIRHPGALDVGRRPGTAKDFSALNGGRHALIVTFRRSGEPIPTPVNFGLDGEGRLYFRSERRVPKVRRIENDPHVRVCPCNFRGKPTGPVTEGRARVLPKEEETHAYKALAANWGPGSRPYEKLADRYLEWHGAYVEVIPA
ncbi:MAG: PPOX class F420-dependent oxidoreductase [Actinobacteria bacterium]|nr:MAG: PPOX class F420-dependent oxidoreductase [Actinomycetota bacterium]